MGTVPWTVYAPTRRKKPGILPDGLDWKTVQLKVRRLQMRIAKAVKLKRYRLVQSLQWLLTHSYFAKLLAVRRVTSNQGKNTPGVDGVVWKTSRQKMNAVKLLYRRGYKASPLRRVYIPKKSGKLRPLGIPTMHDRAMQALYALALVPISETLADPYSYGFRQSRSCADAIRHCFDRFCHKNDPEWILEADIASCFDNISHQWILDNIPVDKKILQQWLKAGFLDKGELFPTLKGTPQGGIISPLIMNMTLDGLECAARKSATWYIPGTKSRNGITVIRYADDFIVTSKSREVLEQRVLPAIKTFLAQRGLSLSKEKTHITNIMKGFDFLGQHVRKYNNGRVLTTPSHKSVQGLQTAARQILKAQCVMDNWSMIRHLNQLIQGWSNYHRHACSSRTFSEFDTWLHFEIRRWLHRRHPNKGRLWLKKNYFRPYRTIRWSFFAVKKRPDGRKEYRDLIKAQWTPIVRHVKIRAGLNPFDPSNKKYFLDRKKRSITKTDGYSFEVPGWLNGV
jgi:RNA-directed DNA polymerase